MSEFYEPYKYWDPFVERENNPPDEGFAREKRKGIKESNQRKLKSKKQASKHASIMESFELFWNLFDPDPEFNNRRRACSMLWEQKGEQQQAILEFLKSGKPRSSRNPYYFLADFRVRRPQTMSFNDYYKRYGTTLETDGWKMVKPEKAGDPPVYYVKTT